MPKLSGTDLANKIYADLKTEIAELKEQGKVPTLATVLVGNNPASEIYIRNKIKKCEELGIESVHVQLNPDMTTTLNLISNIEALHDDGVDGILIQTPLPAHIDQDEILEAIPPWLDVDGFHSHNVGRLSQGKPELEPCTPKGCMSLLEESGIDLKGKVAVVIGKSNIVGKPMALMLINAGATVISCDSYTPDLPGKCREADVIVVATGVPSLVKDEWISPDTVVIDVGINRIEGTNSICGDVDPIVHEREDVTITPVPGGVGPMTICTLMSNTVKSCKQR
jgi:methylenetetrahydrofolate dehydrogenase (NADP+)/methenyltetrahydrofolate cyclohydrolase